MKRTLLFAAMIMSGISFAQITVNQGNIAGAGDVVVQDHDTIPSVAAPSGGANQVWDYSTGLNVSYEDTMNFVAPGWLNNASYFPSATLGATQTGGFEIYIINDATSLRSIGAAGDLFGTGDKQIYINPADVMAQWPMNYNDSYTTNSVQSLTILGSDVGAPADSIKNKTYTTKDVVVDAWGSMTTPYGTFNVLRVNETKYSVDSTWAYAFGMEQLVDSGADTTYNYTFWSDDPSARFPVMEMSHDNAGTVFNVSWLKEAPSAGLNTAAAIETNLYPNPASDVVILESENENISKMNVYNVTGTLIKSVTVNEVQTKVDVSSYNNGVYLYELVNGNNEVILTDRFVVKH